MKTKWCLNKKKRILSLKGISSLELIASVSIFLLITVVIIGAFIATQSIWKESIMEATLRDQSKNAILMITKDLRQADPSSPIQITFPNGPKSIRFAIPETTANGVIISWTQVEIALDTNTGEVTKTVNGIQTVFGRRISSLAFSYDQPNNIMKVLLTATGNTADGNPMSVSLASEVTMRN